MQKNNVGIITSKDLLRIIKEYIPVINIVDAEIIVEDICGHDRKCYSFNDTTFIRIYYNVQPLGDI